PGDLGPDEGLHPVHPGRPHLQRHAHPFVGPGATTDPVPRFVDGDGHPRGLQLTGRDEACETGSDDGDVSSRFWKVTRLWTNHVYSSRSLRLLGRGAGGALTVFRPPRGPATRRSG